MSGGLSLGCLTFIFSKENCLCLMGLTRRGPDCCDPTGLLGRGGGLPSGECVCVCICVCVCVCMYVSSMYVEVELEVREGEEIENVSGRRRGEREGRS